MSFQSNPSLPPQILAPWPTPNMIASSDAQMGPYPWECTPNGA